VFLVVLNAVRVYEDIVEVDDTELVQIVVQDLVDISLERRGGVGKPEREYSVLEVAISRTESRLPLVPFLDTNEVVGRADVKLGIDLGTN
jgi:hypothetical protein